MNHCSYLDYFIFLELKISISELRFLIVGSSNNKVERRVVSCFTLLVLLIFPPGTTQTNGLPNYTEQLSQRFYLLYVCVHGRHMWMHVSQCICGGQGTTCGVVTSFLLHLPGLQGLNSVCQVCEASPFTL